MSIRIEVQQDHKKESLCYVARATLNGKKLHKVEKYGGPEVCDELVIEMAAWLKGQRHPVPDHYWLQKFTPKEQWVKQPFPK